MNYKPMLSKMADFLVNLAVASFAVSMFQGVWYGTLVGLLCLLGTVVIASYLGGPR
jgi:hypothetical protein